MRERNTMRIRFFSFAIFFTQPDIGHLTDSSILLTSDLTPHRNKPSTPVLCLSASKKTSSQSKCRYAALQKATEHTTPQSFEPTTWIIFFQKPASSFIQAWQPKGSFLKNRSGAPSREKHAASSMPGMSKPSSVNFLLKK